jgi:hypothetical protein
MLVVSLVWKLSGYAFEFVQTGGFSVVRKNAKSFAALVFVAGFVPQDGEGFVMKGNVVETEPVPFVVRKARERIVVFDIFISFSFVRR